MLRTDDRWLDLSSNRMQSASLIQEVRTGALPSRQLAYRSSAYLTVLADILGRTAGTRYT